jgi:hypothetical protein
MLQTVADILRSRAVSGWLVGGSVRDRELGRPSPDLDLVVAADPAAVAKDIARAFGSPWFTLSERHGAYRVIGPEGHIDVAAVRGTGILDDLAQRDFTVNAMAVAVEGGDLIDPHGGLAHLREGRLVAVSEHIFTDDPLRLMRAARFCHVLGLALDPALAAAARAQAPLLARAAPERVAVEMVLTLAAGRAGDAARLWADLGLLQVVLLGPAGTSAGGPAGTTEPGAVPADAATPGGAQWDLQPVLSLLDRLEAILAGPAAWFPEAAEALAARLAEPVDGAMERPVALRLAGMVWGTAPAQITAVGSRLHFSSAMNSLLARVAHMGGDRGTPPPAPVSPARPGRPAILYLWAAAPWEPEVIVLATAAEAAGGAADEGQAAPSGSARALMALWACRASGGVPPPPVDGETLMRELGLVPSPRLGAALRAARLAWEAGEATERDHALAAAREAAVAVNPRQGGE